MTLDSLHNVEEHAGRWFGVTLALLVAYQLLGVFYGLDLCDAGFYLTFYDNFFTAPETVEYNFMYYLNGLIGGVLQWLFPSMGMLGMRLAGVAFNTLTAVVVWRMLRGVVPAGALLLGIAAVVAQTYTINVSANPTNGGTVTGGGTYQQGQQCTVNAIASNGYSFTNWTENGNVVSTNRNYTFTVTGNRTLVANFTQQNYTITVSANPGNGGTATGGGTYQQGQQCTVHATANTGYTFTNWTENGNVVSTNANYTFTVNGNRNLVANFNIQSFTVTVVANPTEGGTVTGSGTYNYGQTCTVTATPNEGFDFVHWTENGGAVMSLELSYTFTVTSNRTVQANFVHQTFNISTTANPIEGGTVTGDGLFYYGDECTVEATANEGYDFVNWTENGDVVSTEAAYTFAVTSDRTLTANFELKTFEISTSVDPEEAASISGSGTYNYGDEVTLTFDRNEDWAFQNWTENGEVVSEESTYTFIATESRNLVAHFVFTVGLGENNIAAKVYPNPTKGEVTLEGEGIQSIRIVNAFGQTVYNAKVEGNQARIDLSQMAKGVYMMHIGTEQGLAVRKIVVE